MTNFQELTDFVNRAVRNRKYPEATGQTLRAALKLYETELNPEEAESLDLFKKNFDQITQTVFKKNSDRFTASSLATYKSRVQKVVADFERYGDPVKMNNWSPKVVVRSRKQNHTAVEQETRTLSGEEVDQDHPSEASDSKNMDRLELTLREGVRALIKVPNDMTPTEAKRVVTLIQTLYGGADD